MTRGLFSAEPLDVALALAELGVAVLPVHTPTAGGGCSCRRSSCDSIGKHPRLRHGVKDAAVNPELIRGWLSHWKETNIGAVTGDRLAVIDVDGPDEVQALRELCAGRRLGGLRVRTGRPDGWHVWFTHPGVPVRTRLADSLVRTGSTYVVAPPSLHASGRRYEFAGGQLEPLPSWLIDELRVPVSTPRAAAVPLPGRQIATPAPVDRVPALLAAVDDGELERIAAAPPANHLRYGQEVVATAVERIRATEPGGRHSTVNKSAFIIGGYLDACGLDRETVVAELSAAAEEAGLVSESDLSQTARAIARGLEAGESKPRAVPEMT